MARNTPSRDQIAHDIFGRKFSALELDQKQYVNKLLGVLYNASRQGGDPSRLLSTAAMNETAKIVKQLKEIATNPGDVISLPNGVYQDAARVIHYQSQAKGRGRLLDPREMDKIKKEIAKEFGRVNPGLVAGITDYLTNATGRFSGVGSKVLRSKLGSFLTKGELESISNAEILAARDIVVSHLFDKWSGGNLSSFIKSRLEDVLEDQRKGLRGLKSEPKSINRAELENAIRALEIIKEANSNLNYANRADFRFACKNLGIDFSKIVSPQARGHSANVMHKFAQASSREKFGRAHWDDARSIPKFRMGSGLRFNRRTHRSPVEIKSVYGTGNLATTIRENAARLASDIPSVDMYEYHGTPAEEHWGLDERVDFGALAEDAIESVQEIKEAALEATWKRIEKKGFPETEFVPMGRSAQNVAKMLGYTGETISRSGEATFRSTRTPTGWIIKKWASSPIDVHGKIAPAYRDTTLFRSSHIEPRIVSGTDARSLSRLHEAVGIEEENMDIAVLNEIDEYVDRYGKHGKALYEAWVPLHSDDPQYGKLVTWLLTHKGREAYWAREQLIEKFGSTFPRFEREIKEDTSEKKATGGYRAMEFVDSQFDAVSRLFDAESHHTQKFIGAAEKFREYFNGPSGDIVNLPKHMELYRELAGLGAVKGVKRVGVVGSKSWDNEPFMRKFLNANFDKNNIMVAETSVGKGLDESSFGAGYQAANWAYWEDAMLKKIPVRRETIVGKHNTYKKDWTMKDVIDSSDEIIAFFDEKTLSTSGDRQFKDLIKYIGKKPCRIVWVPTKLTNAWDEETGQKTNPTSVEDTVKYWLDTLDRTNVPHNITFEKYTTGALPHSLTATSLSSEYENGKYSTPIGPLKGFKMLAKGGPLKSNEMAIVGEAGPELLVPSGSGGFNVIPNKALRHLAEGTLPLATYARNVTGEPQPDEHDYVDPKTGEIWPSVTKIKNLGKAYNGGAYYGHVGSVAHYYAAMAMGQKHGIDTSHIPFPEIEGGKDLKGKYHSAEDIIQNGRNIADKFVELADELGFVPTMIEQRFVNERDKYSGTLDIAGFIRDEVGNLIPTIADFKSSSKVDADFAEQIAAYADFFQDSVKGFVINVSRDLTSLGNYEMDLTKGYAGWQKKLQAYNNKFGPRPIKGGDANEDAAAMRLFDMAQRQVSVYDVEKGERYTRQGIGVTTPGHSRALSKIFPKFDTSGATEDETWDKNPSRLAVFSARLDEMYGAQGGIHPTIRGVMGELGQSGWDNQSLAMLAHAPMGSVEDDKDTIDLFNRIYQFLKPIGFNQGLLDTGKNLDATLWNDAIALLNILEEAGKSFESVQYFAKKTSKSPLIPTTVPGPGMPGSPLNPTSASPGTPQPGPWFVPSTHPLGIPSVMTGAPVASAGGGYGAGTPIPTSAGSSTRGSGKSSTGCKGVDLCTKTINSLRKMINAAAKAIGQAIKRFGGGGGSKSGGGRGKGGGSPIPNVPDLGARGLFEKLPIVGLPLEMKRKWQEATDAVEQYDINTGSMDQYNRLLANEDKARKGYYRSIRGATTSFLIAQHVLRVFGQTSQVVNKGSEAVGKGLGYIMDMFLMPLVPFLRPIIGMLVGIGNAVRMFSNPMWHLLAGILLVKIAKGFYDIGKAIYDAPNKLDLLNEALGNLNTTISHLVNGAVVTPTGMPVTGPVPTPNQYNSPIGPKPPRKSIYNRAKEWLGFSDGGVVPGVGNKDSVLAMLTPGEVVISKNNLPHYADGGVVGGVIGNVLGLYGNIMSSDIAQSIVGGLGVVSKSVGAMMAPLAPALAVGAMGGRGFNMVKNAIDRGTSIVSRVSEGGFGALRTVASAQLVGLLTGLGPLLPIAAAVVGVYAWLNGYGVAIDGSLRGIRVLTDTVKGILKSFYDVGKKFFDGTLKFFEWIKKWFEGDDKKGNDPAKTKLSDEKLKLAEDERRRRAREKLKGEEVKDGVKDEGKGDEKKKSVWERITDKFPWLRGVPGMTLLGGAIGAAESKEPIDWAKSGLMGGAAQIAFNVGEAILNKLKLPGGKIMGGLGGFLAPDFGEHIGKAFVSGEGPLGIGKYLGLQGNRTAERAVSMVATQLMTGTSIVGNVGAGISDAIGGTDLKGGILPQILGGNSKISGDYSAMGELYEFGYNNPKVAPMASMLPGGTIMLGGSQMAALVQIANDISKLVDNTKQPTINNNHIEMANSDPYKLFEWIVQMLGTTGNTQGLQRTI